MLFRSVMANKELEAKQLLEGAKLGVQAVTAKQQVQVQRENKKESQQPQE